MSKLGQVRGLKLRGAANPNFGKPWGNALGGFKNQPRIGGRFATAAQAKAVKGVKTKNYVSRANANIKAAHMAEVNSRADKWLGKSSFKETKSGPGWKTTAGSAAAAIGALALLNPRMSISRKRLAIGVNPSRKVGPVHLFSSHSVGIERRSDDFIDRKVGSVNKWAKTKAAQKIGPERVAKMGEYANVDGTILNPRLRIGRVTSESNVSVPGSPPAKKGKSGKPQGSRTGAKTVTNSVKGSAGAVRPQRRGGGKKKRKTKTGRVSQTYTK